MPPTIATAVKQPLAAVAPKALEGPALHTTASNQAEGSDKDLLQQGGSLQPIINAKSASGVHASEQALAGDSRKVGLGLGLDYGSASGDDDDHGGDDDAAAADAARRAVCTNKSPAADTAAVYAAEAPGFDNHSDSTDDEPADSDAEHKQFTSFF